MDRVSVLLIEDDPDAALALTLQLNEACGHGISFALQTTDTLARGLELFAREEFDIVLLDLMLPDSRGLDSLARVRAQAARVPIVVLTGLSDEETALQAVAQGAQDFLVKGHLDPRLLRRALSYALERNRAQGLLENIIENTADGMVVVSECVVRFANAAAAAFFGCSRADLVGRPFPYAAEPGTRGEINRRGPDDEERIAEMRVTPIEWRRGGACLASIHDITELRRLEAIRAEIRERRRIAEFKDQVISTVSHEMRSPLTVVKAAIANLHDGLAGALGADQKRLVDIALRNLERLARIINNFLDLARLESGRVKVAARRVDARRLIRETLDGLRLAAEERRLELSAKLPEDLPAVYVDPDMFVQVLGNLVDNACRFARRRIYIAARTENGGVHFIIEDDGPGIPHDRLGELFNKFVQVQRVAGSGYKGTGLGLAICREIVALNGGRIWAESPPGRGAQFHVTFTAAAPAGKAAVASRPETHG